jgi:hypothetical protein
MVNTSPATGNTTALPPLLDADYALVPPSATPGWIALPGSGRQIYWTGRVAIGLRHQARRTPQTTISSDWIQSLLLRRSGLKPQPT